MSKKKEVKEENGNLFTKAIGTIGYSCVAISASGLAIFGAGITLDNAEKLGMVADQLCEPDPIVVKQKTWGPFSKKRIMQVNPLTGNLSDYKGDKKPKSMKPSVIINKDNTTTICK